MKKLMGIILTITMLTTLMACAEERNKSTQLETKSESAIKPNEEPIDGKHEESIEPNKEDADLDYIGMIMPLGYLLTSKGWDDVDELSATELVMWYADFERSNHVSDASYMGKYLIDGKDGFHFPREELESAVKHFFDISTDALRTDNLVYSSVDEVYITPAAVPIVEEKIALNEVVKRGNELEIHFDLTVNNATSSRIIMLQKNKDSIQYLSYEWVE